MDISKLENILKENNQPKFRVQQILKAFFQDGVETFSEISSLPKDLRELLGRETRILSFGIVKVLEAKDKQSAKALLKLSDGNLLETVSMSPKKGMWSVCVSSQVGCAMGCRFCATGKMGFKRNLTAEEISDQVLFWKQYLHKFVNCKLSAKGGSASGGEIRNYDVSNVVYMGMGEPFLNWSEVSKSLKTLIDKNKFGLGSRSISISTSGVPEGIMQLAKEFPQVNLAISLHFPDDERRSQFMPINKKNNLEAIRQTLKEYFTLTNRQVFFEYIMLAGINDSLEDARKLASYIKSIGKLQLLHVNLIRYNATEAEFTPSSKNKTEAFKNCLFQNRIDATIRKSLGEEIKGACGQLTSEK